MICFRGELNTPPVLKKYYSLCVTVKMYCELFMKRYIHTSGLLHDSVDDGLGNIK